MIRQIPNLLTLSRIFILLPLAFLLNAPWAFLAVLVYGITTDFLDGKLARRLEAVSFSGSLLDPVADKLFSFGALFLLGLGPGVPSWYSVLVFLRYFLQLLSIPLLHWVFPRQYRVKPKIFAKLGTSLVYLVLVWITLFWGLGLLSTSLYLYSLYGLILISSYFELMILITYLPRLVGIIRGTADCFE